MGSCEQDLKTLDHTLAMLKEGTMDYKQSNAVVSIVGTKTKIRNQMLQVKALAIKHGKKWTDESRMIGGAIDSDTKIQDETVYCRAKERSVTRRACKEYSEMSPNVTSCQSCPNWKITRRLLKGVEI